VLVKAFINLTGMYPVGSLVVIDSFPLATICSGQPRSNRHVASARS